MIRRRRGGLGVLRGFGWVEGPVGADTWESGGGVTGALESAGRTLWVTVEGRRGCWRRMGRRILELGYVHTHEGGVDAWPGLALYV